VALDMEPVRIGWLGAALGGPGGWADKIHRMAFDEAIETGVLNRPVEFVIHPENGLPQGSAKNAIDGFLSLVEEGCIGVAGAYSSDNGMVVAPYANDLEVPLISWCGTERFHGDYCFRLGNGDCGGDAALIAGWLKRNGHERVAVINEISPNGEEYFRFFRQEARRRGITIGALETVSQTPDDLAAHLRNLQRSEPDALVYMGYGMLAAQGLMREALDALQWDPPRIMTTAFMFYLMGFDKFEGWVGIDQYCPDNPLVEPFVQRYRARYDEEVALWPNAIPLLAYDTARVLAEGLHRAPVLSGPGLKAGLENLRFLPSTTGGPHTHIAGAPHDHNLFKGDWLLYGRVRNGKLEFDGLFEPWED
jgi:ABC-type branched-subunit amino acid transport system substrate-binding protein